MLFVDGKKVIGVEPWSKRQLLKIYWLMGLWTIFFLYLIIMMAVCGCLWLIFGESILLFMGFLISMFLTRGWYRREERKNFIFEEDEII